MGLYEDWYIFANRESTRFYVFMKTVSTGRNKDELSFELCANQSYSLGFKKVREMTLHSITYGSRNRRDNSVWVGGWGGGYIVIENNDKQGDEKDEGIEIEKEVKCGVAKKPRTKITRRFEVVTELVFKWS